MEKKRMKIMRPETLTTNSTADFRAPPPSPVASDRRSTFENDDFLTDFIQHSLKVPDLILPDRVFPRQKSIRAAPKLDFQNLGSLGGESAEKILRSIGQIGFLEVINHGISQDMIERAMDSGDELYRIPSAKKTAVARSPERQYGFDEIEGDDEEEARDGEEFLWNDEEKLSLEMEGIWPNGYSNFRKQMEILSGHIEEIAVKILHFLFQHSALENFGHENCALIEQEITPPRKSCYIHKHTQKTSLRDELEQSLRYEVIKMLIKGFEYPHALCLHICNGSTDFHVYSKKGWLSFCPSQDSLIVTIGDKLQDWSGTQYKHVIGRPMFKGEDKEKCISMGFLYSPSPKFFQDHKIVIISLAQQAIFAIYFILACQLLVSVYNILLK